MATKAETLRNPRSCWNKAQDDEQLFVLRAHDPLAPVMVRLWASRYIEIKGGWQNMTLSQREKFHEAIECAEKMERAVTEDIPF